MSADFIVCMAMRRSDPKLTVNGSVKGECSICIEEVFVAPSTVPLLANELKDAKIICDECFLSGVVTSQAVISEPTPQQKKAIREIFGDIV